MDESEHSMKERICVCGMGKVGMPILETFGAKGFDAIGYDHDLSKTETSIRAAVRHSDAAVFIVPTPSLPDGSFANNHVETALRAFYAETVLQMKKEYLFIVSSTTTPGSCDQFRKYMGPYLCYKPEFIRLEYVREDLLAPAFILIGEASKEAGDRCETIYRQIADVPVKRMSLMEAELAKITLNCALTTKISLANQLHLVAQKLDADSEKIMEAVGSDPRIGNAYLKPGAPYGGPCLPRDNRMFQFVAERVGVKAHLSEATDKINGMVEG
jgi:UDPglucose 6-dehydrogenase